MVIFLLYILKNNTKSYRMDGKQCHISLERKELDSFKRLLIKKRYFDAAIIVTGEETLHEDYYPLDTG